jgi:hypothetical protein
VTTPEFGRMSAAMCHHQRDAMATDAWVQTAVSALRKVPSFLLSGDSHVESEDPLVCQSHCYPAVTQFRDGYISNNGRP